MADAIAVEPQRPVRAEAPPRLVAVVDEARIRQVLANLLGNVRAHTPLATPVAVRLGEITGGVLIEVVDAGPGMSTQDAIRAFDRFHRATDRPAELSDPAGDATDDDMAAVQDNQHQDRNGADLAAVRTTGAAARQLQGPPRDEPGQHREAGLNGHRKRAALGRPRQE